MLQSDVREQHTQRLTVESFLPPKDSDSVLSAKDKERIERLAKMLTLEGRQNFRPKYYVY